MIPSSTRYDLFLNESRRRLHERRAEVRVLTQRSNWRALTGILGDWLIIFACIACSEWSGSRIGYLLSTILIAIRINAIAGEWFHEAVHGNLFTRKSLHEKLQFLYGYPIGMTTPMYRAEHATHHRNYVLEGDNVPLSSFDYWYISRHRWSSYWYRVWIFLIRPLTGLCTFAICTSFVHYGRRFPYEMLKVAVFWSLIILTALLTKTTTLLALYWFVPFFLIRPILWFWQDVSLHFNTLKSPSRDVRGFFWRLLMHPHQRGAYHNMHHLVPGIPWFNLHKASSICIEDDQIDVATGFVSMFRQMMSDELSWDADSDKPAVQFWVDLPGDKAQGA